MCVRVQKGEARWVLLSDDHLSCRSCVPQAFLAPIRSRQLPESVKEMGHSIISSRSVGSTCPLMQRGSKLVRAVAGQGRESMRHGNSRS